MSKPSSLAATLPLLIESNLESELHLPLPSMHYCITSRLLPSVRTDRLFVVANSAFEKAYYEKFFKTAQIGNYMDLGALVKGHLESIVLFDISLLVQTIQIHEFLLLMEDLAAANASNIIFFVKSDMIQSQIYLSGIRKLFSSHITLSKLDDKTTGRFLVFLQTIYKSSIQSQKSILDTVSNTILPFETTVNRHRKEEQQLPTSSFSLGTTEKQKLDRAEVQLPFLKAQSLIEYIPDAADDIDEEDPDADLEF